MRRAPLAMLARGPRSQLERSSAVSTDDQHACHARFIGRHAGLCEPCRQVRNVGGDLSAV